MRYLFFLLFMSIFLCESCKSASSEMNKDEIVPEAEIVSSEEDKESVASATGLAKGQSPQQTETVGVTMDVFDPDYINGRWEAEDQNGYSFGAWFDSDEGMVIGQYCAMNHDASRIDCGTHEEIESCYMKSGPVKGKKILELEVVSCYALKKGRATIAPQEDGNLVWRLVEEPGVFEVDHFAPKVALLRKVSFDPYE